MNWMNCVVLTVAWLDELRCFIHVCWRRDVWNWIPSICNQNISNDYFDSNCVMYVTQIELNSKSSSYISVARWVGCVGSPRRWSGDQIVTAVQLRRSCRNDVAQTRTTQQRCSRNSTDSSVSPFVTAGATGVQAAHAAGLGRLDWSLAATVMTQQQFHVGAAAAA